MYLIDWSINLGVTSLSWISAIAASDNHLSSPSKDGFFPANRGCRKDICTVYGRPKLPTIKCVPSLADALFVIIFTFTESLLSCWCRTSSAKTCSSTCSADITGGHSLSTSSLQKSFQRTRNILWLMAGDCDIHPHLLHSQKTMYSV